MLVRYNGFGARLRSRVVSSGGNPFSKEPIIERSVVQSLQTTIKREKSPRLDSGVGGVKYTKRGRSVLGGEECSSETNETTDAYKAHKYG